jgi:hypothetical protein
MEANQGNREAEELDINKSKKGIFAKVFGGEILVGERTMSYIPLGLFIFILLLSDVGLQYLFEDYQKSIHKNKRELDVQHTIYNEKMSLLESKRRQSQVAQDIARIGLKELSQPPVVLELNDTVQP